MTTVITWTVILLVVAALGVAGPVLLRALQSGESPAATFFKPRPDPRLEVIETARLDGKRSLVLIRRDDVEHLVMTGGPVDVVIETGIGEKRGRGADVVVPAAQTTTVFTRPGRSFGQTSSGESS